MILNLTLKVQWYNLIERGIKLEEYRDMTDWWTKRIWEHRHEIEAVRFTDYRRTMVLKVNDITIGRPKREWTAFAHRTVYIIHLGERIQ